MSWPQTNDTDWTDGTDTTQKPSSLSTVKKENLLSKGEERLRQLSGEDTTSTKKSRKRGKRRMPSYLKATNFEIDTSTDTTTDTPPTPPTKEIKKSLKTASFSSLLRQKSKKKIKIKSATAPILTTTNTTPKKSPRCTPKLLNKIEACSRTLVVIFFAISFGLDLVQRMAIHTTNNLSNNADPDLSQEENVYLLDDDASEEIKFGSTNHILETESLDEYVLIQSLNEMSTNYAVSAVFIVCCSVTLIFATIRIYLFPYKFGSDNKTNAPEAELFRTLTSRKSGWMTTVWNVVTAFRSIFDDVCVFVVALVLVLTLSS